MEVIKSKKRSGKLTFHKFFNKETDYQDWTNQINFLIKNNQNLTLVQLGEKNSKKFLDITSIKKPLMSFERRFIKMEIGFDFFKKYWKSEMKKCQAKKRKIFLRFFQS